MIRRGEHADIAEPLFEYLKSVYDADIEGIDKYTPASENSELKEEVMKMPGMSQVIFDKGMSQGITQGIKQGISQGAEEKQKDDIRKLAEHFVKENPGMTIEQATDMAKKILK